MKTNLGYNEFIAYNSLYWIEIKRYVIDKKWKHYWLIKCRNGRVKARSNSLYTKSCLCINDANAIGKELNMEVRIK